MSSNPGERAHERSWAPSTVDSRSKITSTALGKEQEAKISASLNGHPVATCGFISGRSQYPLTCHEGESCASDPSLSLIACCSSAAGGVCSASTRCLDRTDSALENLWDGRDLVCRDERAPFCKTDIWDGESTLAGYSLFICDTDKVTETVFPSVTKGEITSISRSIGSLYLSTDIGVGTGGDSTAQTSSIATRQGSNTPVGTIVGATVGSIGGISAIVAGLMLLRELWKKRGKSKQDASERQGDGSPRVYQLDAMDLSVPGRHNGPAELPDSPTTVDGRSELPVSSASPVSPVSPLTMETTEGPGEMREQTRME